MNNFAIEIDQGKVEAAEEGYRLAMIDLKDSDAYKKEVEEWTSVLARLWAAVDKPIDKSRIKEYKRELSSVPFGLLEIAVGRCIRENEYNNVPTIGKIWSAVRRELGNPHDIDLALEQWVYSR
jgi:hypothetical protein